MVEITPLSVEKQRKPYQAPAIVHELTLETRAGSPLPTFGAPVLPGGESDKPFP